MFTAAIATLGYVVSPEKNQVLMIHRNTRPDDLHFGKYLGLSGQLEPGEDIVTGMCRKIQEESGLLVDELVLRGTVPYLALEKKVQDFCVSFGLTGGTANFKEELRRGRWNGCRLSPYLPYPCGPAITILPR